MKRTYDTIENGHNANARGNAVIEGVVIVVTQISDSQGDKRGKYWTALICDTNQNVIRITKYLSSKTKCSLREKMLQYYKNKNGVKLNKLKLNGDDNYIATYETTSTSILISFTPICMELISIENIQSMSDGQYVSFTCKIIDIGPDEPIIFNNGGKRVQKLKRLSIVADKTGSINMNIWQNQFESIKQNLSYTIKLAKVKVFNDEITVTTTTNTTCELVDDIQDINCSDSFQIPHEITTICNIRSIALIESRPKCSKCYSSQIDNNGKTIKCLSCKSRTICPKQNIDQTQIQLTITNEDHHQFELIVDIGKIRDLLLQLNYKQLAEQNLVEDENVLLVLSSVDLSFTFNPQSKHINSIAITHVPN
ncbi:unnamed protein product [Rotaria socialis]|uniref:Uncharacterized protein n=1 Tax=Rotaria socialis TaxID=392032 RepID=A0A821FJD1_9BILA|nr:unnamed protein product [Rotaria socialis]CAF4652564.1 unnamed protein product [Rotaria socialis]